MSIVFDFEDINRRMNRKPEKAAVSLDSGPTWLDWCNGTVSPELISELSAALLAERANFQTCTAEA